METIKFKTSLKCSGCVAAITPALNEIAGHENWQVNLDSPDKTLTVQGDDVENEVISALQATGYTAEKIS